MDNNNWRPIQGGEPAMDTSDWRTQLQPEYRQRIVNEIMDTLKKHLPFSGQEGLLELKKIVVRFEEEIYTAATSQQQQLHGTQTGNSSMQTNQHSVHMLQQSKAPGQQQPQQSASNLLPTQGQQSQPQQSQQQLLSQIQSQPMQMQQQLGLQQQPNPLQRDMQQRLQASGQASGSLLQQQNVIDQQKQLYQSQRPLPETSSDSTAQTGHANGGDWQEEVYQKIKTMKDMYYSEINDMYQKIAAKLQQHDSLHQRDPLQQHDSLQQQKLEQLEKLNLFKTMLERILSFLQIPKSNISPSHKEKLGTYEKQIVSFINTNRPGKPASSLLQGQLPPPHMHSMQLPQSQINQVQSHENQMNPQTPF